MNQPSSRVRYLRKMYFAVFIQMLLTAILTSYAHSSIDFHNWLLDTTGLTFIFSLIVTVVLGLASFLYKAKLSRPIINYVALIMYSISFAILFSYLDARYSSNIHSFFLIFTCLIGGLFLHILLCFGTITFQNASLFIFGSVSVIVLQ